MTMIASGVSAWPEVFQAYNMLSTGLTVTNLTFDSTADKLAWVGTFYGADDVISTVKFRVGTIAATAGTNVEVRIETVSNGRPSGTLVHANYTNTVTIADTDDNTFKTATFTSGSTITAGTQFAIVIQYITGADDGTFAVAFSSGPMVSSFYPYCYQDTGGGTYAHLANPFLWIVTLATRGVTYFPNLSSNDGAGSLVSVNNGSAADERALRFQSNVPRRLIGMRVLMGNLSAGSDFQFALWSDTGDQVGEELAQTGTIDGDFPVSTTQDGFVEGYFTAAYTIAKDTTYYAGVKSLAAANAQVGQITFAATGDKAGYPLDDATQFYLSVRTWDETQTPDLAGAWTDTTTAIPIIQLIYDQLDDGAGAGGGGGLKLAGRGGLAG